MPEDEGRTHQKKEDGVPCMRHSLIRTSALAAVITAGLVAAPPLGAQQQPQQQPGAAQGAVPPSASFSEEQLDAFAAAAREVTELQQEYGPRLETAGSPEEAAELREEATNEMMNALEEQGLSQEEYSSILQAAQTDATLYASIVERMRALE